MAWREDHSLEWLNWLRFAVRSTWVLCAFIIGMFLLYLTARVTMHVIDYLERSLFSSPWG